MWKMKWKASWYAEFQTCVYSTIRGVNVLFFCFFFWSEGFSMLYDMWNQVPSQRHVTAGDSKGGVLQSSTSVKEKGSASIVWNQFISSPQVYSRNKPVNVKIKLPFPTFFSSNGVKMKDRDAIQERKRTHGGLLSCSHVWAWTIPTAYLNSAFSSFLLTRIILIYWC